MRWTYGGGDKNTYEFCWENLSENDNLKTENDNGG